MGNHDALGPPRSARCVVQGAEVIGVAIDQHGFSRSAHQIREPMGAERHGIADHDDVLERGSLDPGQIDQGKKLRLGNQHPEARIAEQIRNFVLLIHCIDG